MNARLSPRRCASALVVLLLLPLLAGATGGTAHAHSSQTGSTPAADARLDEAPSRVTVTFDSPLLDVGAALVVRTADGSDVTAGPPEISRNEISVPVRTSGVGEFTVVYRVVSQDGHTITSTFGFTVIGSPDRASQTSPATATGSPAESAASPSPAVPSPAPAPTKAAADEEPAGTGGMPYLLVAAGLLGLTVIIAGAIALRR